MASNNLEVARYVDAKQNGKHLVDGNEFTYKKSPTHAEKVYYICLHTQDPNWLRRHRCGPRWQDSEEVRPAQPWHQPGAERGQRGEEDKAINAASTNHTWHDLKNLVAQFESMTTNLFMDSLIDFYNDIL